MNSLISYGPIPLLCIPYKLIQRVMLTRITLIIECILPPEQAGFRRGRSTLDQVAQITDDIEKSFDMGQAIEAVFLDLTSAYDTVWLKGLHLKIQKAIPCRKTTDFILNLLYNRSFVLFADGEASKPYKLKNGVAQESIQAAILYNVYTSDFLSTSRKRHIYADDVALTCSDKQTSVIEHPIFKDLDCVSEYYRKWHRKLSTTKLVSSIFHLKNYRAQHQLQIHMSGNFISFDPTPRYLGVTLDRSLTFRQYIEKLKNKMTSGVALVK